MKCADSHGIIVPVNSFSTSTPCHSAESVQVENRCRLESIFRLIWYRNQTQDVGILQIECQFQIFFLNTTREAGIAIRNSGHKKPVRGLLLRPVIASILVKILSASKTCDMSDIFDS